MRRARAQWRISQRDASRPKKERNSNASNKTNGIFKREFRFFEWIQMNAIENGSHSLSPIWAASRMLGLDWWFDSGWWTRNDSYLFFDDPIFELRDNQVGGSAVRVQFAVVGAPSRVSALNLKY